MIFLKNKNKEKEKKEEIKNEDSEKKFEKLEVGKKYTADLIEKEEKL